MSGGGSGVGAVAGASAKEVEPPMTEKEREQYEALRKAIMRTRNDRD